MEKVQMSNGKRHFIFSLLFLGWIVDSLTLFGMNIAIIPISKELNLSETQSGMVISSFWLSSACMTLLAGWVSDKFGSRKIIVIALFIISLFSLLTGMVGSFVAILAARLILGLGDGGLPTGSAVAITEIYKKGVRARAKSMLLAAQLLGGVLALYLTAVISDTFGWRVMFYIIGGLGLVVTLLLSIYYHPPKVVKTTRDGNNITKTVMKDLYKHKMLWIVVIMYFGSSIAQWGFSSWMPSYLESSRDLNLKEVGSLAMIPQAFGLASAIITGYLIDKTLAGKEKYIILFGTIIASICLLLMYYAPSIQLVVIYQSIYSIGGSAIGMTILSIPLKHVSENIVGSFMGTMYFVGGLAGFIAPTVMGALIDAFGSYQAAFFFLVVALGVTSICSLMFKIPKNNDGVFESASSQLE
ncbi:MFS transporter [Psychrobacillus sp. FSL H8-0484]|uniref:MFS transporter n=1 Tax=Psychrobacillus sp. FSL H8-0484 TaxID=2921390 RepID=UPI0030F4BB80